MQDKPQDQNRELPPAHMSIETRDGDYVSITSDHLKFTAEYIAKLKAKRAQSAQSATPTKVSAEPELKETPAIFCRMCGKKIAGDSKFCMYCGEKVIRE